MTKIVSMSDVGKKAKEEEIATTIKYIDVVRDKILKGQVKEYVIASVDENGEVELNCCIKDRLGGIGLFEMGKSILMQVETDE
jgi:hypothetical protein